MWTPDADWVMKERPWYIQGIKADDVTFGDMYLDADTGSYIVSVFTNISDQQGNVIGVISADVQLDAIEQILREEKIFNNGYAYAVEKVMGLAKDVKADGEKTAGAGQKMSELSADLLGEVSKFRL